MSRTEGERGWLLAVHVGAGNYGAADEAAYAALMRAALARGRELLASLPSAQTQAPAPSFAAQVVAAVLGELERSDLTNCGAGANLTESGRVECEASVVCGKTRLLGACAGVRGVAAPSGLALALLDQAARAADPGSDPPRGFELGRQPPLVVAGDHARQLAQRFGLDTARDDELDAYQVTAAATRQWDKWRARFESPVEAAGEQEQADEDVKLDTVGAVCMDPAGNVAAALSSGGVAYKTPGRVGLAGCPRMGCDAANTASTSNSSAAIRQSGRKRRRERASNALAVACSGRGEHFIRSGLVATLARRLGKASSVEAALRKAFADARDCNGGVGVEGGALALLVPSGEDRDGPARAQLGVAFSTPCMGVGFLHSATPSEPRVQILRQPARSDGLALHVSFLAL